MLKSEMKNLSMDELKTELEAVLKEQFNLRLQQTTGQLTKTAPLRAVRRQIARLKTFINKL
jgi:large subunit ribosomal protein L29